jgi:hypothetical protein
VRIQKITGAAIPNRARFHQREPLRYSKRMAAQEMKQ